MLLIVKDLQYNKIYPDEKVRRTPLCILRMVIRIFQHQTDKKIKILQPEPEKHRKTVTFDSISLYKQTTFLRCRFRVVFHVSQSTWLFEIIAEFIDRILQLLRFYFGKISTEQLDIQFSRVHV